MLRRALQLTARQAISSSRTFNRMHPGVVILSSSPPHPKYATRAPHVRNYARQTPRHPSKIVNEDELFDVSVHHSTPRRIKEPRAGVVKEAEAKTRNKTKKKARKMTKAAAAGENPYEDEGGRQAGDLLEEEEQEDEEEDGRKKAEKKEKADGPIVSTKLYENEELLRSIMMELQSKKQRKKRDLILLEGVRLMRDAIKANIPLETVVFSRWEDVNELGITDKKVKLYKVPYRTIQMWSTLTTSPGIMGLFKRPAPKVVSKKKSLPITIVCDNVRDPGNMGAILRAAAGVGCEKVILTKGCVDFWDSKVVRSATGAHFRVPVIASQEWPEICEQINPDAQVYVADNNGDRDTAKETLENFQRSANAHVNAKYLERKKASLEENLSRLETLPLVPYYSVEYARSEVVIIVGGETEGLSEDCFEFVEMKQGVRVNIPLDNGIESLNCGMALGVVAFEAKRQFLKVRDKLTVEVAQ